MIYADALLIGMFAVAIVFSVIIALSNHYDRQRKREQPVIDHSENHVRVFKIVP